MAVVDVKFGGVMHPAPAVQIRRDKSVKCSIGVTNTGNVTIPAGAMDLYCYYGPDLASISGSACEDMQHTWSSHADYEYEIRTNTDVEPGSTYTFIFTVDAAYLSTRSIDAGFVLWLDTDGDRRYDTCTECLLINDAFEVVEA